MSDFGWPNDLIETVEHQLRERFHTRPSGLVYRGFVIDPPPYVHDVRKYVLDVIQSAIAELRSVALEAQKVLAHAVERSRPYDQYVLVDRDEACVLENVLDTVLERWTDTVSEQAGIIGDPVE